MERNLTKSSVFNNIIVFSLPYLLSYLLQTFYGMADLYIIGQFEGVASTTAVSIGSQVMHMLTVMIVGLAMGATVFIGQAIGGSNRKKAALGIGNTVTLFMAVSVPADRHFDFACKTDHLRYGNPDRCGLGNDRLPDNLLFRNSVYNCV